MTPMKKLMFAFGCLALSFVVFTTTGCTETKKDTKDTKKVETTEKKDGSKEVKTTEKKEETKTTEPKK
jgi:ABC-type oligopeptide transport system substrate-binding subunit